MCRSARTRYRRPFTNPDFQFSIPQRLLEPNLVKPHSLEGLDAGDRANAANVLGRRPNAMQTKGVDVQGSALPAGYFSKLASE